MPEDGGGGPASELTVGVWKPSRKFMETSPAQVRGLPDHTMPAHYPPPLTSCTNVSYARILNTEYWILNTEY